MEAPASIDVCIPSLQPLKNSFIKNLRETLPVHRILVSSVKGRGPARQDLIDRVETDWFAFVDDDVRLLQNWWPAVCSLIDGNVGAVEGLWTYAIDVRAQLWAYSMERLAKILRQQTWKEVVSRPYTGDTLILTDAVNDIKIPNVNFYEDAFIGIHLKKRGYQWVRTPEVVCEHLRLYNVAEAYESGRYGHYFGLLTPGDQLRRTFFRMPLKIIFALCITGSIPVARLEIRRQLEITKGVLQAHSQNFRYNIPSGNVSSDYIRS